VAEIPYLLINYAVAEIRLPLMNSYVGVEIKFLATSCEEEEIPLPTTNYEGEEMSLPMIGCEGDVITFSTINYAADEKFLVTSCVVAEN
jgi:hypothetical protein